MSHIDVVKKGSLQLGGATPGIFREKAFESGAALVSKSTISPGTVSSWHHHGTRRLYGYVASGRLRLDLRKTDGDSVEVAAGDFFHIPPGLAHRDVNAWDEDAVIVNVSIGEGPAVVNVEG